MVWFGGSARRQRCLHGFVLLLCLASLSGCMFTQPMWEGALSEHYHTSCLKGFHVERTDGKERVLGIVVEVRPEIHAWFERKYLVYISVDPEEAFPFLWRPGTDACPCTVLGDVSHRQIDTIANFEFSEESRLRAKEIVSSDKYVSRRDSRFVAYCESLEHGFPLTEDCRADSRGAGLWLVGFLDGEKASSISDGTLSQGDSANVRYQFSGRLPRESLNVILPYRQKRRLSTRRANIGLAALVTPVVYPVDCVCTAIAVPLLILFWPRY